MIRTFMFLCCACAAFGARAVVIAEGDYQGREDVAAFIEEFAASSPYSEADLLALVGEVRQQSHLFEKLDKPAEKELHWYQYRAIFIKDRRIERGIDFWRQHRDLLDRVSKDTGVPVEIIVAIIGVETFYGHYKGKDPVFDSLVTLAFDYPRRAAFFRKELEEFLLLAREQSFDVRAIRGSYAGAMGVPQFISSSYRAYAIDFDDDGRIDLFDNTADIAGSVANYFVRHGWRRGERIARPLRLGAGNRVDALESTLKPNYSWAELKNHGLESRFDIADDTSTALIRLQQRGKAEYWAGFYNFYVITRYNHSEMYAMAVFQLAKLIRHRYSNGG